MYTERHDDRYGGRVPSKKGNTKMDILKIIFSLTGRHLSAWSSGLTCSCFALAKIQPLLHGFGPFATCII